eukprot:scaffold250_cov110-Isochrysis_galbana.AAC.24
MQALASLHVRFKIHDGYDSKDEDQRKPSEKLTAEKLEMLDSAAIDPNGELTLEQKDQVRQLLARRIDAFALNPKSPSHTHLVEVELRANIAHVHVRRASANLPSGNARGRASSRHHHCEHSRGDPSDAGAQVQVPARPDAGGAACCKRTYPTSS